MLNVKSRPGILGIIIVLILLCLTFYVHHEWDYDCQRYRIESNLDNIKSQLLGKWYTDLSHKYHKRRVFDKAGIPLVNYAGEMQYNPVAISQYALSAYEHYLIKKERVYEEAFLNQANWLVENMRETVTGFGVWQYNFDLLGVGDVKAPWVSAMAQGLGISVLLRAYQITNDEAYFLSARKALASFKYPISQGGVRSVDDGVYYEEVPSNENLHILNGFITSLFGIYDFYRVTRSEDAFKLFDEGVRTLEHGLSNYDTGFWSKYEFYGLRNWTHILEPLATMHYHNEHISQLEVLAAITEKDLFEDYSEKWNGYQHSIWCKLMHFTYSKLLFRFQRVMYYLTR
jgi:hypothetical protein